MARTRVKICGITRPEDAALAAELGADAIGLNFVGGPRKVTVESARVIVGQLLIPDISEPMPHFDRCPVPVALCHAPSKETYEDVWPTEVRRLGINRFQIYGTDTMQLLQVIEQQDAGAQIWLVAHISTHADVVQLIADLQPGKKFADAVAVVVDAAVRGQLGGTGKAFDWTWIKEINRDMGSDNFPPIILAGGLTPENVGEAIRVARPYAVDVSSGVEVAGKPGIKDPIKMRDFIQAARGV